jgi:F0F1-type ATP synthase membrane subunit a
MPALVLYLFPKITNVAEEIFDFLEGDILEGVFGS